MLHARVSQLQTHMQLLSSMYTALDQEYQALVAGLEGAGTGTPRGAAAGWAGLGGGTSGSATPGYEFISPAPSVGTGGALAGTGGTSGHSGSMPRGPRPSLERGGGGGAGGGGVDGVDGVDGVGDTVVRNLSAALE